MLLLYVSHNAALAWLLRYSTASPSLASMAASLAIEQGAQAATVSGSQLTVVGDLPLPQWSRLLEASLDDAASLDLIQQEEEQPCASEWQAAATNSPFPPILLRPLWIAPVQSSLQPPPWAVSVRLLESDDVFLTTTSKQLHASSRMLLQLLAQK